MGIYTKKGDQGNTSNLLGDLLSKDSLMIELQGSIDEINAACGYLRSLVVTDSALDKKVSKEVDDILKDIQHDLFMIGGDIAGKFTTNYIKEDHIKALETGIDDMTASVGSLQSFIYYNGTGSAAYAQVVRSIVRRGERAFVRALKDIGYQEEYPKDYQFINRLSDYCFTLSRYINYCSGLGDEKMSL